MLLIHKQHPPGRLLRWALALQEYTFTVRYCKGSTNIVADSLSRAEHQAVQVQFERDAFPIHREQLMVAQQNDPKLLQIIQQVIRPTSTMAKSSFILINNILHQLSTDHQPRIYVPRSLQHNFLSFYHDHPLSGHLGFHKVLLKLRTHYYWPKL